MVSASTPSANETAKDLILVHRVQLKTMIKAHFSGRMVWSIQVNLHREPPEVGLVAKVSGSFYWWVELCVPTLHQKCYLTL